MNRIALLFGLFIFCMLVGCGDTGPQKSKSIAATADWAMKSNFKFDFNGEDGQLKQIVRSDKRLIESLLDAVYSGERKAYDYYEYKLLNTSAVAQIYNSVDTITVLDYDSGKESLQIVENELNRSAVKRMRILQEWHYDHSIFDLQCQVIAAAPLLEIYNEDGSYRGDLPLFWVYFDENKMKEYQ